MPIMCKVVNMGFSSCSCKNAVIPEDESNDSMVQWQDESESAWIAYFFCRCLVCHVYILQYATVIKWNDYSTHTSSLSIVSVYHVWYDYSNRFGNINQLRRWRALTTKCFITNFSTVVLNDILNDTSTQWSCSTW